MGKKDIKKGIVVSISTFEDKVGVAVGVTNELTKNNFAQKHFIFIFTNI